MSPEHELVLGDRYVLTRRIAIGGMGEVWEANDRLLSRRVAVKILKEELRTAPSFLERFRAEARHAGRLSHPGIATVYDYGETDDVAYLVMELVAGRPLSDLLVEQPELPNAVRLSILSQAADALHAAHLAGVVHRDVKPANLIVAPDGTVKVTDFGIARAIGAASLTEAGQVIGTAHYMSPEQATGKQATSASDIYSLGVIAYEMFAGRRPFEADTPLAIAMAHVHSPVPAVPQQVPGGVADLIRDTLSKDPGSRPSSAAIFAVRARREMHQVRAAPTLTMQAATPATSIAHSPVRTEGGVRAGIGGPRRAWRSPTSPVLAFLAVFLLIAGTIWLFAARSGADPSDDQNSSDSGAAAGTEPPPSAIPAQSAPAAPATGAPSTVAPATAAPATTAPVTAAPSTTIPSTTIPSTTIPSTTATTAATTMPPVTTTAAAEPPAPVTPVPSTAAPVTATPAAMPAPDTASISDDEALAFVLTYYDQVNAGEYETTWPKLTQEFRDARNLTFESYVRYWRNTSLELGELRYTAGPGPNEGRVRMEARYTTARGVVEEIDELTIRRTDGDQLVIAEQRIVS